MSNLELLNPENSALILIDFQPQMTFGVASIDRQTLINNVMLLAKSAKLLTYLLFLLQLRHALFWLFWPQILDIFPNHEIIERSSMNSWEDPKFVEAVKATGRKKLIFKHFGLKFALHSLCLKQ